MSCYCKAHPDEVVTDIECLNKTYNELLAARRLPEQTFTKLSEIAPTTNKKDSSFKYLGEVIIFNQFIANISSVHSTYAGECLIEDGTKIAEEYSRL